MTIIKTGGKEDHGNEVWEPITRVGDPISGREARKTINKPNKEIIRKVKKDRDIRRRSEVRKNRE